MSYVIDGKVALVSGGAGGIGLKCVESLLEHGAKGVAIVDFNAKLGSEASKNLGDKVIFIQTDVSNEAQYENAFQETIKTFGTLDIVINNAGVVNENNYEQMIGVNVNGVILGTQLGFKYMSKVFDKAGGVIINMASMAGLLILSPTPLYTGSKHFVVAYSRAFGTNFYYNQSGVRILAICPGFTRTAIGHDGGIKTTFKDHEEHIKTYIKKYKYQKVESVSKALIDVLIKGGNGSVWVVNEDKPAFLVEPIQSLTASL